MALIVNAKGRGLNQPESGYTRVLGQKELGNLISRVQATVISAGTELEKFIWERARQIKNIDAYLENTPYPQGVFMANKTAIKKSKICQNAKYKPDFLVFETKNGKNHCYILELKDGDQFDTKKSGGEKQSLDDYLSFISRKIQFLSSIRICCFNAKTKKDIVNGFKKKFKEEEVWTGEELCQFLNINYQEIVTIRKKHQEANLQYFITELKELFKIPEINNILRKN